jgi:hypothetical protein
MIKPDFFSGLVWRSISEQGTNDKKKIDIMSYGGKLAVLVFNKLRANFEQVCQIPDTRRLGHNLRWGWLVS